MQSASISGDYPLRLVVVESEVLAAFDLERRLSRAGHHVVATLDRVETAIAALADRGVDGIVAGPQMLASAGGATLSDAATAAGATLFTSVEAVTRR